MGLNIVFDLAKGKARDMQVSPPLELNLKTTERAPGRMYCT
jgi:hypothetical protein